MLTQAERLIRRGELTEASEMLGTLQQHFPSDPHVAARLAAVRALADPRSAAPGEVSRARIPTGPAPEEVAESRIAMGDVATGIAIYEKILAKLPNHPRARVRLSELRPAPVAAAPVAKPLPADPVEMMNALLSRIQANRRS